MASGPTLLRLPPEQTYFNLAYSDFAAMRIGMSGISAKIAESSKKCVEHSVLPSGSIEKG